MVTRYILDKLRKIIEIIYDKCNCCHDKTTVSCNRDKWNSRAQEGEFLFHLHDNWRQTESFHEQTARLFEHFQLKRDDYRGLTVVDLGAGSKLRTKYFRGAKIVAIEPLASRFMREIEWCDLAEAEQVYDLPAEEIVVECIDKADLVVSINVLDHCFDFAKIIENIHAYLKKDGLAFLSFDKHMFADNMHPLVLTEDVCEQIFSSKGLDVIKYASGAGDILKTYGHGEYCMNYWLKRGDGVG